MAQPGVYGAAKEKGLLFSGSGGALTYFKGTGEQANYYFFFLKGVWRRELGKTFSGSKPFVFQGAGSLRQSLPVIFIAGFVVVSLEC